MKLLLTSLIATAVLAFLPGCANEYSGQTPLQQSMHHSAYDPTQNPYAR